MTARTCDICGCVVGRILLTHTIPDRFERALGVSEQGYRRSWAECECCGSAMNLQPEATLKALDALGTAYYEVDFPDGDLRCKFDKVMALSPEKSDNAGRVRRNLDAMILYGPPAQEQLRCLDIGSGLGVFPALFSKAAAERGRMCTFTLYETDDKAAALLRSIGGFSVIQGLFDPKDVKNPVHLLTLNKVLEHVRKPIELLKQAAQAVDPEAGIVYVEVPDVLTAQMRPAGDNILGALHHHIYTPAGLALALHRAGLEVLQVERIVEPSGKLTVFAFAAHVPLMRRIAA